MFLKRVGNLSDMSTTLQRYTFKVEVQVFAEDSLSAAQKGYEHLEELMNEYGLLSVTVSTDEGVEQVETICTAPSPSLISRKR